MHMYPSKPFYKNLYQNITLYATNAPPPLPAPIYRYNRFQHSFLLKLPYTKPTVIHLNTTN